MSVFVYAIAWCDEGPVKVGVAKDVAERIKQLQTGCPHTLQQYAVWHCSDRSEAMAVEGCVLDAAREAGFNLAGEWVDIEASFAPTYLEAACTSVGVGIPERVSDKPAA